MGTIKDRKIKGITEAEDIKKRWQEYTKELYKKILNDPDNLSRVRLFATLWTVAYQAPQSMKFSR